MTYQENNFELNYNTSLIKVDKQQDQPIYHVRFSNEIPDIDIISKYNGDDVEWDTLPAGNLILANAIGMLIEKYYKDRKN